MNQVAVGIGLSSRAGPDDIVALVALALAGFSLRVGSSPCGADAAWCLAVPRRRARLDAATAASRLLGLPLRPIDDDLIALMQPFCLTRPRRAAHATAEAAALAASGPGAVLLGPRVASRFVTCALARGRGAGTAGA